MRIFHIEFAKTGNGVSGGETCMIETILSFQKKGIKNILMTTEHAKSVYTKIGLIENEFLSYRFIKSSQTEEKYHIFISYLLRTISAVRLVKKTDFESDDVLLCHSDFFPNSIPSYVAHKKQQKMRLLFWYHLIVPKLFRGFEGAFTNKFYFPKIRFFHHFLNQKLYEFLIPTGSTVLTPSPYYANMLTNKKYDVHIIKKFGGAEILKTNFTNQKEYDLVWMGRFQALKGMDHFLNILILAKKTLPNLKVLVLGGGTLKQNEDFENKVRNFGLINNITFKGFVTGEERFKLLSCGKIFIMSSIFESYGLVNIEAMSYGLPVIAFDLPVFSVFTKGMIKIPMWDHANFASSICLLLTNNEILKHYQHEALRYSSDHSWTKTADEILSII